VSRGPGRDVRCLLYGPPEATPAGVAGATNGAGEGPYAAGD
jgi:hypothetical protein